MSTVAASMAADFLSELSQDGSPVVWKQRTITGTDPYSQPEVQFVPTTIAAIIGKLRPSDVKLVDAGFQMQQYLWMHYAPSVNVQMLDRITYGGLDYEVRFALPYILQSITIYGQALLRYITE